MYYNNMTQLVKAQWQHEGDSIRVAMPFAKIDKENRLVMGFATMDNLDSQGDVVTAEASQRAFARARGNLREMHQPIAVGKIVDFREEEFFDGNTQQFYRGIFVTAYVSKGAQDTWEKVLDGTLTGFSIGGGVIDSSTEFVPEANKVVKFVTDYELTELSLVDNPANQLANIFSIMKMADGGTKVEGMVTKTKIENVFWCDQDEIFQPSNKESMNCGVCGVAMKTVGWFEDGADVDRTEKVRDVATRFLGSNAATDAEGEGGVEMSKEIEKSEEAKVEETEVATDETATEVEETAAVEETTEEAGTEEVTETPDEADVISKKIDDLKDAVESSLEKAKTDQAEALEALSKKVDENRAHFEAEIAKMAESFGDVNKRLETAKENLSALEEAVEKFNKSGSVKKSGDVETQPETVQKSNGLWNGAFSVDTLVK